jgi:hypothetical protein
MRFTPRLTAIIFTALSVSACARDDGQWPALVPIDGLLEAEAPMDPAPAVEGRAAALQARAARLRGSVITPGSLPNY